MQIPVWTRQGAAIETELRRTGRYIARRERIAEALGEDARFFLTQYDWLRREAARRLPPPEGAGYPIWVSLRPESALPPEKGSILLALHVAEEALLPVDIARWSRILDGAYLAAGEEDLAAHRERLAMYGCDDARAVTTPFYPELKREIMASWPRLFDVPGDGRVGLIWEIRADQIGEMIR